MKVEAPVAEQGSLLARIGRGIGERAESCIENFADRERIPFASALRRCSEVGELATRSLKAIQEFVTLLEEFEQLVADALGLPRRAFDGDHYDIPQERYAEVVAAGATQVSGGQLIRRLIASGLRIPARDRQH